jgi:hypothetical protein
VAAAIHHPGDEAQEALPDAEEAPAQTEAPSGSTPVGPGGSRDFRQRTQSS